MMTNNLLKKIFTKLPVTLQEIIRSLLQVRKYIPFTAAQRRHSWVRNAYWQFGQSERRKIFLSMARFFHINRPMTGYYLEFGSHEANTMRMAYDNFRYLFDFTYVSFDSFEGLPDIENIDKQLIWKKGGLKTEEVVFKDILRRHGMPMDKVITVKGFYDQSLTPELKQRLLPKKAAVIYVDCDLYLSTIPVLEFIVEFLQIGTIIVFDDWNCFHGRPDKGERLAFSEFRKKYPNLQFEEFVSTNEAQAFIFVGWAAN
jgi:O-methyltransferase